MASNANDNAILYTPVRVTNPEDITGGGGGSSTITAPLGSKVAAQSVSVVIASDQGVVALDATLTGGTQQTKLTDGTNVATVKAASTASVAADKAVVVAISPNNTPVLPTGASTAAKQPALGTAGTASADVITVQGRAGMTELLVQLIAGAAAFGKLAANTAGTYIGDVVVALATTPFQATDTLTTAGTRQTLASHGSNVFGFYITNTHATATVYIGVAATVSSTAYIFRLAPGQVTPLIPLANSNTLGFDASANSATITYGGF